MLREGADQSKTPAVIWRISSQARSPAPSLGEKLLAEEAETWAGRTRVVSNLEEGEQAGPSRAALEAWDSGDDLGGF